MLKSFNEAFNDESNMPNIREPVLFSIWKKYVLKCMVAPNPTEAEARNNGNEGILDIDSEMDPDAFCSAEGLFINEDTEQPEIDSFPLPSRPSPPCTSKPSTPVHNSVKTSKSITRTPEEIWKDHLHWPNIEQSGKRKKKKIPFAGTSEKWKKSKEAERAEKEFRAEIKNRKQKERVSKKEKKVEEAKWKKTSKKTMKKIEEAGTSSDDAAITMHDSHSSLVYFEDLVKCDSSESHVPLAFLQTIRVNHSYVIVEYENEFFPGLVTNRNLKKYEVRTMAMCVLQGLNWKWPEVEDKIWNLQDQIKEIIKTPELVSATSSRSSGVYLVPEIQKYSA